ncbi:MAG: replication initiation protein [Burkholderiaceae bacterium]|nr:replication initiation protein [Burkholderiaceae bacterium]
MSLPVVVKEEKLPILKKAQEAIAILPKSGKVTLLTRRIFNALLQLAQEDGELSMYRCRLSKVLFNASFDSNNTEVVKEQLRRMASIQVEWNSTSGVGERRWGVSNLLADAEVIEEKGAVWIEWSYSEKVRAKLLDPEIYARISLQAYSQIRSSASAALYEICARYVTNPSNLTMRAPWQWWRPRLTGNPEDAVETTEYKFFKRDVLKPSIAEVNRLADICVELLEHKEGRRVTEIQFRVTKVSQGHLHLPDPNMVNTEIIKRLVDEIGLMSEEAAKVYADHDEPFLMATINLVREREKDRNLPALKSTAAFFKNALRGKYASSKKPVLISPKRMPEVVKPIRQDTVPNPDIAAALDAFDKMDSLQKVEILEEFAQKNALVAGRIRKSPESPFVRKTLGPWLAAKAAAET